SHFRIKWLNVMSAIDYSHYDGEQLVSRARKPLDNTAARPKRFHKYKPHRARVRHTSAYQRQRVSIKKKDRYYVRHKVSRASRYMHNFTT
ncbi:hypothetical protein ALC56_07785, partial [Trachymyrmex septentrionalis]